jgi:hypothetical protein
LNGSWEEITLGSQLVETQSPLTLLCQWIIIAEQHISQKVTVKVVYIQSSGQYVVECQQWGWE